MIFSNTHGFTNSTVKCKSAKWESAKRPGCTFQLSFLESLWGRMSQVCTQNFLLSLRSLKGLNYGKKGEGFCFGTSLEKVFWRPKRMFVPNTSLKKKHEKKSLVFWDIIVKNIKPEKNFFKRLKEIIVKGLKM